MKPRVHKIGAHSATHPIWANLQLLSSFRRRGRLVSSPAVKRILPALICGWLLAPHGAQAKSSAAARLEVVKGPSTERCLDEQRLAHAVETRLRRRVFRADVEATLHVK